MSERDARARRSTFGPVVLLGLGSAALAAVAGHHSWVTIDTADARTRSLALAVTTSGPAIAESPGAAALALVCLATWGVLLVTRGRWRRALSVLGLVSAAGLAVTVVIGFRSIPDAVRDAIGDDGSVSVGHGHWYWLAVLGAIGCLVGTAAAVRLVPTWPEMGSRYDAPDGSAPAVAAVVPVEEQTNLDLWKSIDEGHDPTV